MNQQETKELVQTPEAETVLRDWERSDWFQEWLHCHCTDAQETDAD